MNDKQMRCERIRQFQRFAALITITLVWAAPGFAEEWTQFRGSDWNGRAEGQAPPVTWSATENVKWSVEVPGEGWSSPVVSDGRIWITTALNEAQSLHAMAFDLETGETLVDEEIFAPESVPAKHATNSYASPTAAIADGRVFVHYGTMGTAALDAKSGEVLWKNDSYKIDHEVGPGSSLIAWNDLLFVTLDGTDLQFLVALDQETGKEVWRVDRPDLTHRPGERRKAFSTPLLLDVEGKMQLISPGADHAFAYEALTGKPIWSVNYPGGFSNVPQPVFGRGLVFICTGFGNPDLLAVLPNGEGNVTDTHVKYTFSRQVPLKTTPLFVNGLLYMLRDKGIVTCLNASSGDELWKERIGGEHSASPIYANGRIYIFGEDGKVRVLKAGEQFELEAENDMGDGMMATPAFVENEIIIRTRTKMFRIGE